MNVRPRLRMPHFFPDLMSFLNFWAALIFPQAPFLADVMFFLNCRAPLIFSSVLFLPDFMLFQNFQVPPNFSNVHFFQISCFSEFPGTPEFFQCPIVLACNVVRNSWVPSSFSSVWVFLDFRVSSKFSNVCCQIRGLRI